MPRHSKTDAWRTPHLPSSPPGRVAYRALDELILDVAPWRSMLDSCDSWSCQGCGHLFSTKRVETGWPPQREPRYNWDEMPEAWDDQIEEYLREHPEEKDS